MKNITMKRIFFTIVIGIFLASPAFAQVEPGVEGDDTITVLDADDRPEAVDRIIELPAHVPEIAVESSQHGMDTANEARERNREFGMERAREAREGNIPEHARDREARHERPERPDRPEHPDRPDMPDMDERPDVDRPDRPEQPDRPDMPDTSDTPDRPEQPELPENVNPGRSDSHRGDR